jgi:hypothetical protein
VVKRGVSRGSGRRSSPPTCDALGLFRSARLASAMPAWSRSAAAGRAGGGPMAGNFVDGGGADRLRPPYPGRSPMAKRCASSCRRCRKSTGLRG